jgi:hypothetical protein
LDSSTIEVLVLGVLDVTHASEGVRTISMLLDSPSGTSPGSLIVGSQSDIALNGSTVKESVLSLSVGAEALERDGTISVIVNLPVSTSVDTLSVGGQTDGTISGSSIEPLMVVVLNVSEVSQSNDSTVLKTVTGAADSDGFNRAENNSNDDEKSD